MCARVQKTSPANFWLLTGYSEKGIEPGDYKGFSRKVAIELDDCPFEKSGMPCELIAHIPDSIHLNGERDIGCAKTLVHAEGVVVPTDAGFLLVCTKLNPLKRYERKPKTNIAKGAKYGERLRSGKKGRADPVGFHTADDVGT